MIGILFSYKTDRDEKGINLLYVVGSRWYIENSRCFDSLKIVSSLIIYGL
jgi:hypothetical protein